jgi:hypothetical protein
LGWSPKKSIYSEEMIDRVVVLDDLFKEEVRGPKRYLAPERELIIMNLCPR